MPRPLQYNQRIGDAICARVARGESMRRISKKKQYPSLGTMMKWLARVDSFAEQYAKARLSMADHLFDEMLEIADFTGDDWIERDDGTLRLNGEAVSRSKLRIETRKWIMGKLNPKKYKDDITLNDHSRNITQITLVGEGPAETPDNTVDVDDFILIGQSPEDTTQ